MASSLDPLLQQFQAVYHYRRTGIRVAWTVFPILALLVFMVPPSYTARAQFYLSGSTVLEPLLEGVAVSADAGQQADIVKRTLLARPTLDRVARDSGLYEHANTPQAQDAVLLGLEKKIDIQGNSRTGVYLITYVHSVPETAAKVVDELLQTFIKDSTEAGNADAREAATFFRDQVQQYAERLNEAEQKLADFKKRNIGLMPDDRGDYFARLQQEMTVVERLETEYQVALSEQAALRGKISASGVPVDSAMPTPEQIRQATLLDSQVAESRRQLDDLLLKFTDRHPQVVALRDTIQRLEARRREVAGNVRATVSTAGSDAGGGGDAVVSSLQIGLNGADVRVAALRAQLAGARARVAQMRNLMAARPEVEAELSRLNRDYGVTKERYETLLKRLESANTSDSVERTGKERFQVIEEPTVPVLPSAPARALLVGGSLIAALLLGVLAALLHAQIHPVYLARRALENDLHLPVIGVISLSRNRGEVLAADAQRRRETLMVAGLVAAAVVLGVLSNPLSTLLRKLAGSLS
ncbi:MAG: hypothetical protein RL026_1833 [Pseudomonadota bacterium]